MAQPRKARSSGGLGRWMALPLAGAIAFTILWWATPHPANPVDLLAAPASRPAEEADLLDGSDTSDLTGLQSKFESVAHAVSPTVVAISAAETASDCEAACRSDEINGEKLDDLLNRTTRTVGTGVIFDADGYILTNEHVIEDSEQFWVTTDDHKVYPAIVVGADPRADLAVLKIPAGHLPTASFETSGTQRGQWALTLGNPYGLATEGEMSLSVGVISATDRSLPKLATRENRLYSHLLQTTAQINPGNSGGPLFDLQGRVIGVNAAVILPQKQTNGIGFAIPVTKQLLDEVASLREGQEIVYGYFGVVVSTPTISERRDLGIGQPIGIRIEATEPLSPAAAPNGLLPGDVITTLNGESIEDADQFVRLVGSAPIGKPIALHAQRARKWLDLSITPIKRPVQYTVSAQNQRLHWRGMVLGPVPANWPGALALNNKGVNGILVIAVNDDSPLKTQGVTTGSVITAIAGRPVSNMVDLQKIVNDLPPDECKLQLAAAATQVVSVQK